MPAPVTMRPSDALADDRAGTDTRAGAPPIRARTRRMVIDGLRAVARRSRQAGPRRRQEILLCQRAAAVSAELLELAALLDITDDPDPPGTRALLRLLTDGGESPLYNPRVHVSELQATLDYARRRLSGEGH
jgi:hypothetical protein